MQLENLTRYKFKCQRFSYKRQLRTQLHLATPEDYSHNWETNLNFTSIAEYSHYSYITQKYLPVNITACWRHCAALSVKRKQTYQTTALRHITTLISRYHNTLYTCVLSGVGIWSERVHAKQWFSETWRYVLLYLGYIPTRCARGSAWPKALTPVERRMCSPRHQLDCVLSLRQDQLFLHWFFAILSRCTCASVIGFVIASSCVCVKRFWDCVYNLFFILYTTITKSYFKLQAKFWPEVLDTYLLKKNQKNNNKRAYWKLN